MPPNSSIDSMAAWQHGSSANRVEPPKMASACVRRLGGIAWAAYSRLGAVRQRSRRRTETVRSSISRGCSMRASVRRLENTEPVITMEVATWKTLA
jgi:hypothetical protein